MAAVSRSSIKIQTKSISLPSRSHPTTLEIEEQLNQMKSTMSEAASSLSSEAICISLSQMTGLYKCMNHLLASSTTTQLLLMSHGHNKKRVEDLVDESVKFLDIYGSVRDLLSEMKYHCRDILCAIRRTKRDLIIQDIIRKHSFFTKKVRKQVRGLAATVKQVDKDLSSDGLVNVGSDDQQLAAVIRAVISVTEMTILVFDSMLLLLSSSVSKPTRWSSVVSKIMQKKKVGCVDRSENRSVNGFESVDAALRMLCKNGFRSQIGNVQQTVQCRLERVGDEI